MSYTVDLGEWNSVFAVPCSVVDKNLKMAGSVQLKVLLWMLRHAGEPFETQAIAEVLGIDKADISDAIVYWQETGLITAQGDQILPAAGKPEEAFQQPAEQEENEGKQKNLPEASKKTRVLSRPQKPDSDFVARRIGESTEIACLMQSAQEILGRLISNGESATLLMIHDDFGLPSDVIIMLLQYAASLGKANMRYIEKVAIDWADQEINTHEKAEEKLQSLAQSRKAWRFVEQALGIPDRAPSRKEEQFAVLWVQDWEFSADMLREAYDRVIDSTGKFSSSYMNRILERWYHNHITTTKQAQEEKEERAAVRKKGKNNKLTFDIDEYERTSIYDTKE